MATENMAMEVEGASSALIGTKSRFSFMDLPVEIRLKIYEDLLIFPQPFVVSTFAEPSESVPTSHCPAIHLLQTCKLVNEEATPIFYSNNFLLSLPLGRPPVTDSSCDEAHPMRPTFQLSYFRWSTIARIKSLSFISGNNITFSGPVVTHISTSTRPAFTVNGKDIMARFSHTDVRYSPQGPDVFMSLSISNWLSMKVMRAELNAFQEELETMMRSVPNMLGLQNPLGPPLQNFPVIPTGAPVPVPQLPQLNPLPPAPLLNPIPTLPALPTFNFDAAPFLEEVAQIVDDGNTGNE